MGIKTFIFDLDGVLTDTAEYHYQAWQRLADEEGIPFAREENENLRGISRRDSLEYMLSTAARQATEEQMQEMMERKNRYYRELIQGMGASNLLPGAAELLEETRQAGFRIGVASVSKNARDVIASLEFEPLVDAISDGYSVERHKPAPDLFLHAAQQLDTPPGQCVVVEDAASGIEAAKAAGMWSVGLGPVERVGEAQVTFPSLAGVRLTDILTGLMSSTQAYQGNSGDDVSSDNDGTAKAVTTNGGTSEEVTTNGGTFEACNTNGWLIREHAFDPAQQHHKETVFALGNGYLGTRGTFEERYPGDRQATLINGVFDDAPVVYTELANAPDWLSFHLIIEGERFSMERGQILAYERILDMHRGLLRRTLRWQSPGGHTVDIEIERWASLADPHLCAIRYSVTLVDFEGSEEPLKRLLLTEEPLKRLLLTEEPLARSLLTEEPLKRLLPTVELRAGFNSMVDNEGLTHWHLVGQGNPDASSCYLHSRTRHTRIDLCQTAHLDVEGVEDICYKGRDCDGHPAISASFHLSPAQKITATKLVTIYTSRDTDSPLTEALGKLKASAARGYQRLKADHMAAWRENWETSDVLIEGDDEAQRAIRFNLFQALAAAPRQDDRISIPAKTLSGFGYRGHVFWDTEIFIVPFLTFTQPDLARNLLMYRYHTLPGARRKAANSGYEGAMYAWESAATGDETTPRWVPLKDGELLRIWCGDIELHITTDVAYAAWNYWQTTGDDDWMRRYGAEIFLDTAIFWASRVEENAELGCYEVRDIIGPDEYHEHVDNNAFTNRMIQWHLETAQEVLAWLRREDPARAAELEQQLDLTPPRLNRWADIASHMLVLHDPESGLFEQFEGFFALEDVNLADYEPRTRSMQSILSVEGANRRQVLKQPDVLALLYMLPDDYDQQTLRTNWDYYAPRTDHTYGSSLGPAIHAILACELDMPEEAYEHFMRAALVDLKDMRGNTADGIHAASAGGVWQAFVFGFGGVHMTQEAPVATPRLPAGWQRLKFRLQHRGEWHEFDLKQ